MALLTDGTFRLMNVQIAKDIEVIFSSYVLNNPELRKRLLLTLKRSSDRNDSVGQVYFSLINEGKSFQISLPVDQDARLIDLLNSQAVF